MEGLAMTPKTETLTAYPANYHEARDAFRRAAQELNAQIETHVVLSGAEYGGDLTIDVALVGVANPDWSLVLSSGLHGIEGFFGSAIQTAYMRHREARGRYQFQRTVGTDSFDKPVRLFWITSGQ